MSNTPVKSTVRRRLREFLDSTGRSQQEFEDDTNLISGLGLSSDEGVDFVLDLCESLQVDLPADFNPFVDETGRRGLRVSEMLSRVENLASRTGTAA